MALDIGALQFGGLDIGTLESLSGSTPLSDSVADDLLNLADEIGVNLVNLPVIELAFSDDLQSIWQDAVVTGYPHTSLNLSDIFTLSDSKSYELTVCALEFADALTQLDDVALNGELHLTFLDIGNSFYDEVDATTIVYQHPDEETLVDSLELKDSIEYIFEAEANLGELGDSLYLSDELSLIQFIALSVEDNLDNFTDEVVTMPGEFVELSYDTMMYEWADAIEVDTRQHRSNGDTLSMSDAVSTNLAGYLQTKAVAGNLSNWADAVSIRLKVNREIEDDLNLYDFVKLLFTHAMSKSDTLSMSDSVSTRLTPDNEELADSLELWNDLVAASLTVGLEKSVNDSMSLSDATSNSGIEEDLTYYRRYLNDVIR